MSADTVANHQPSTRSSAPAIAGGDEYLTLQQLAQYSKVSVRQLKRYLALPDAERLPHVRNGRRPLILRSSFDAWMAGARPRQASVQRGRSFSEIMEDFAARKPLAKSRPRPAVHVEASSTAAKVLRHG